MPAGLNQWLALKLDADSSSHRGMVHVRVKCIGGTGPKVGTRVAVHETFVTFSHSSNRSARCLIVSATLPTHTYHPRCAFITRDGQVRELDAVIAAPASVDAAPMDHYQFGDLLGCGPCLAFIDKGKSARARGDCIGSAERHPIHDTDYAQHVEHR